MSIISKNIINFVTKTVPEFVKAHPWETAAGVGIAGGAVAGTVYAVNKSRTKTPVPALEAPAETAEPVAEEAHE